MDRNVDLCCGAGGFSCGFQMARRGDHFIGVDINTIALATYRENIENSETIWASIETDPVDRTTRCRMLVPVMDLSTLGKVDNLLGGIPCPPFSGANIRGRRDFDRKLVDRYFEIRDVLRPRWWVLEESPHAAFIVVDHGETPRFLRARDFEHMFQDRRRLVAGNYPEVLPRCHNRRIFPAIRAQEKKAFNQNMRYSKKTQSCCQWFGRRLTTWELQVLMGFPPDYHFHGDYGERCIQIGNAVCPPVAKAVRDAIVKASE